MNDTEKKLRSISARNPPETHTVVAVRYGVSGPSDKSEYGRQYYRDHRTEILEKERQQRNRDRLVKK